MTIKVKDASQRAAVPASPAQIAEIQADLSITTPTAVQTLIEANDNLGALSTPVQTLVNAGVSTAQARAGHTGNDPAANVVFADNLTLEQWRVIVTTFMSGASPTAPSLSTDPAIATTTGSDGAVGSIMTATTGTVVGTATTVLWQWNRVNASTASSPIVGATSVTYQRTAQDFNQGGTPYRLTVTQTVVGSTGLAGPSRTSAQSSATTAAAPSNTVAPAITPSGSQAAGVVLTSTSGTFTGGAGGYTYGYQFYLDGAGGTNYSPIGTRSATATITPSGAQTGKLRVGVIATDSNGIASPEAYSNVITVTGTSSVTNATPPALAATVTAGVQAAITQATWNLTGGAVLSTTRSWAFYLNGSSTAYRTNTVALYTPEAEHVGKTVLVIETVTDTNTGLTYSQAAAATKTIQAVPATLAATQAVTGISWTAGSAISSVTPVTASGGTTPYVFSIDTTSTSALPSGLSINTSTGAITGTPASSSSLTTYTIKVVDSASSPATVTQTFTATVASAGVTPLTALAYPTSNLLTSGSTTALITDPVGSSNQAIKQRVYNPSYPSDYLARAELYGWSGDSANLLPANNYWWAFRHCEDLTEYTRASAQDDEMVLVQTHTRGQGATQPDINFWIQRQTNTLRWSVSYNTYPEPQWANQGGPYPDYQGNTSVYTEAIPTVGVPYYYIVHYRPGYTLAHDPLIEVWRSKNGAAYEKIINYTGFNTYNVTGSGYGGSYLRMGPYKYNGSKWNSQAISQIYSKMHFGTGLSLYNEAAAALESWKP